MKTPTPSTLHMTYGDGEYSVDIEKRLLYLRLASIHEGSDIAARYIDRAAEILRRMNEYERRGDRAVTR